MNIIFECIVKGVQGNIQTLGFDAPLITAIGSKKLELVKFLVESGANVNQKFTSSLGPISPLKTALEANAPEIVQYLLQHGAKA